MEKQNILIVITDCICNNICTDIKVLKIPINLCKNKETIFSKKVGPPTLVRKYYNKIKEVVKKVGPSTLVKFDKMKNCYKDMLSILSLIMISLIARYNANPEPIKIPHQAWSSPSLSSISTVPNSGMAWAFRNISNNQLQKMINGNRRLGYNIGLWNCRRGLVSGNKEPSLKMIDVKTFLQKKKLHLLCLVEADLHASTSRYKRAFPLSTKDIHKQLEIPGYKIFLPKTWSVHGQARVIVYAKNELKVVEKDVGIQNSDLPTITLEIALGREKKTLVNFFYREFTSGVSGLKDTNAQTERLSRQIKYWKHIHKSNRDIICLGDANLCAIKWYDDNYNEKTLAELVQSSLLETSSSQLIKEYTRSEIGPGGVLTRSCIDHCYTNVPEKVSKPEVIAVGESDHLGIVVTKYTRAPALKPKTVTKRSYKYFSIEHFLTDILNSNLNEAVCNHEDLEEASKLFEETFRNILDIHAPIKTFQMRKYYSPYVSDRTKQLMKERNELKEEATKSGKTDSEKEYKKKGKAIKKAIGEDEREYYGKDFGDNSDSSTAWKTAKVILGMNNNLAPTVIKKKNEHGEVDMVTNPIKMANLFNQYFRKKVEVLREKTNIPPKITPTERLKRWLVTTGTDPPPFWLKPIDKIMFRRIMKKMKATRVHGLDWIDSYSLKISSPLIEDCLIHLINLSIEKSLFSSRWKPQLIFPTHKKNEKDLIENYRPVCHLVQVGKMTEYAVYFQIVDHFTSNNLFHPNHHGSLAHHSTATAITQLFDMWLEAAEKQELSAVCLLDQSAAYDLLCHKTLKEKLALYNFNKDSIAWIMSYLSDRSQQVQVESKTSAPLQCGDHAVPQGSVLGGLLHVINSNDLPACHEEGEGVVYVDDDSDTVHASDPQVLTQLIETEANNSADWMKDNRLCVSAGKSKLLIIGTKKLKTTKDIPETKIVVDEKEITATKSEKLLGVVVNDELTWKNHLHGDEENDGLIPQLAKRIGILKKLSKYMTKDKLKTFVSGLFYSKMSYCLPVFGNVFGLEDYKETNSRHTSFTMQDNHQLQVLQNKVNRLLLGASWDTPTVELLRDTGTLSVQQMIAYQTAVSVYKIVQSGKPTYLSNKLRIKKRNMNLRGRLGSLSQVENTLSIAREGFIFRGASIFNKIDENIRNETKLEKFKVKVKEWVKNNIEVKPSTKFPSFARLQYNNQPPQPPDPPDPPDPQPNLNSIRRYLTPAPITRRHTQTTPQPKPAIIRSQNRITEYFHPA